MNGIGNNDVESYVRSLVSEGFGKQCENAAGSAGLPGDSVPKTPLSVPDQPNNRK
ncbi:MAG: hypothetical protein JRE14_03500 [Deltaproteobacteria bacterium]|nr:hypothetical protein [Deltaproteobacteria bacterium]